MADDSKLTLRAITKNDIPFLFHLYKSIRSYEMTLVNWSTAQKEAFLSQQFNAQHFFYQAQYPDATFDLILFDGKSIGRIYVDRREKEIRIIDLAILPEYQNRGIGSKYLHTILAEGLQNRLPISFHVEKNNPALNLYLRLGFRVIHDVGAHFRMEWAPD